MPRHLSYHSPGIIYFFLDQPPLQGNPYQHDHNVHALLLATVILVAPHAVGFLVPIRSRCTVHAAATHVGLAVRGGRRAGRGRLVLGLLGRGACGSRCALGLVELRGRDQVLDNRAVDGILELGGGGIVGGRFRDYRAEDVVL